MNNNQKSKTKNLRPIHKAAVWLSVALILGGLLLWTLPTQAAPPAQAPDNLPSVSGGRTEWDQTCSPCHGPTGQGDGPTAQQIEGPLPDFSDSETARQLVPAENFEVIKNGRLDKLMPPWGNRLSDAQIWDKVAYIWSLSTTPEDLSAGEAIYLEHCLACHGQGGAGDGPEASVDMVAFTDLAAMVQRSQADLYDNFRASDQHTQVSALSDEEIWQALDYIRTFSFAIPQSNGTLTGQVINATNNESVGGVKVLLHVMQDDVDILTLDTLTDENGEYTFEKLSVDPSLLYIIEGIYEDVAYVGNEPGTLTLDSPETAINLNVYETTTDDSAISITQLHYILSFSPNAINVVQIFVVGNDGRQTYIGQDGQTIAFSLPVGATRVAFQNDPNNTRFIQTEAGYVDTTPVIPGEEGLSITIFYDIPYDDDALTIEVPLPADVATLDVLMSDQGANLSSDQIEFIETHNFQGTTFSIFNGTQLNEGETLTLTLTGLDRIDFADLANIPEHEGLFANRVNQNLLGWIVVGLGGLTIVLVGVVYPLVRPRPTHPGIDDIDGEDLDLRRQKLLLILVRLDEVFEAGELDEAVYHQARAKYKAELAEMMEINTS